MQSLRSHLSTLSLRSIVLGVAALLLITACTTTDPYTGESRVSRTTIGAGIGALGGAAVGALATGDATGALVGAGIGGLAGAGIGQYMDRQESELRRELANSGVGVARNGDEIQLIMPGNITFATGRSEINAEFYRVLNAVALVINKYNETTVTIAGFTDNTGPLELNEQLSLDRARSVAAYLVSQDLAPVRIRTLGYGPDLPVASNDTPEGRALNRRVEIVLTPLK